MNWLRGLKGRVKENEPLKRHTTFKIGGPAELFVCPKDIPDLKLLLKLAKKHKLHTLILGAGSNILAPDSGVRALVIKLDSEFFKRISSKGNILQAGSGALLPSLIMYSKKHSLSGFEPLSGIPGSVGGALAMNAGSWGRSILDLVQRVRVLDYAGREKVIPKEKIKYAYRKSSLSGYIILGADFKLEESSAAAISYGIKEYLRWRRASQDNSHPNAGCIFKNPKGKPAGRLIELCGLKGKTFGGALISPKHANFILNAKGASSEDILKLILLAKKRVKNKFNVLLSPEIKIW